MAAPARSVIETRWDQMFPTLDVPEIDRLRRFGEPRAYPAGERLIATGELGGEAAAAGGSLGTTHD